MTPVINIVGTRREEACSELLDDEYVYDEIAEGIPRIARVHLESVKSLLTRGERHTRVDREEGTSEVLSLHIH